MGTYIPTAAATQSDSPHDRQTRSAPESALWRGFAIDRPLTTLFAAFVGGFLMGRAFGRR